MFLGEFTPKFVDSALLKFVECPRSITQDISFKYHIKTNSREIASLGSDDRIKAQRQYFQKFKQFLAYPSPKHDF